MDRRTWCEESEELLPTRASLLERLRELSDTASWQEFFDTYWKLIFRTARHAGLTPSDAEDVVQETIIAVARHMPGFRYRPPAEGGSFKSWLLTQTKWRMVDRIRRNRKHAAVSSLNQLSDTGELTEDEAGVFGSAVDARWDHEWELTMFERGLQRLKRRVPPRQYQVFYLLEVKDWSPLEVSRQMGIGIASTYTTRHRLRKQFRKILDEMKRED